MHMPDIKICGIKREDEVAALNDFPVSYAGFIFAESRRKVTIERAKELRAMLREDIKAIGVFVDADMAFVKKAIAEVPLDGVQLHGQESPEYCSAFDVEVWKCFGVSGAIDMEMLERYQSCDGILLDTSHKGQSGGTSMAFDWNAAEGLSKKYRIILAGGLNPDNVSEAIRQVEPAAVDLNSGLETEGFKSRDKVAALFQRLKEDFSMNKNFGDFGGQYVPEALMYPLKEIEEAYKKAMASPSFHEELNYYLKDYVGRETPLYYAEQLTKKLGGAKIYLKREDLNHTGAHKINNVLGQILLAKRMGKKKVIAETGAGQHGVATATGAALFGMECTVYMGKEDVERQALNVFRMELLGAKVVPVTSGLGTLKDATNEAIREWVRLCEDTFYIIGSVVGPHPYPTMVRDFQRVIGDEARKQILEKEGRLPDKVIACVGGGSNAIGIFHPFVEDKDVELIGVEAGGLGISTGKHAVVLNKEAGGTTGMLHGMKSKLLTDEDGNIIPAHSISAGLDYPGIGPEHAYLQAEERASYEVVTDQEALDGFELLSKVEGIIPALESAHAIAYAAKIAPNLPKDHIIIISLSGRGDKDTHTVMEYFRQGKKNIESLNK